MKRIGLSIAIAAALGLSACGGSSGGSSSSGASASTVSGTASKGIIIGGLVSAYLFDTSGAPEETAIATAVTDENGDYSLSIPAEHDGKPIYIVIDDNDGAASMKCDIAGGCDNDGDGVVDAVFGANLELDADELTMSAVLPESAASVSVNITPLTTVAAEVAKVAILEDPTNDFIVQEAISNANSQVAERFGLSGDVTQFEIVDLTDPEEVADTLGDTEGDEAVQYAAINAAIISAVQSDSAADVSIDDAIANFAAEYVGNGLTTNSTDATLTDLGDILEDAQLVLTEVTEDINDLEGDFTEALADLGDLGDDIAEEKTDADEEESSDTGEQGTASPTAGATNLAKVKAFVEELRELGTAIDSSIVENAEGVSQGSVEAILDNFDIQAEAADLASGDDVEKSIEGLGLAIEAMVEVYANNFNEETGALDTTLEGSTITALSAESPAEVAFEGISVIVSLAQDGSIVLSVDQNVTILTEDDSTGEEIESSVAVDASATVSEFLINDDSFTEYETETTWGDEGSPVASIDLAVQGTSSSGGVLVTLGEDSGVSGSISGTYKGDGTNTGSAGTYDDFLDGTLTNLDMGLEVTIAETEASGDDGVMTFVGDIDVTLNTLRFIEDTAETWSHDSSTGESSNSEDEDLTLTLGMLDLRMAGTFGNDSDSFDAVFTLSGDATGVTFTDVYNWESSTNANGEHTQTETHETSGETEAKYVGVSSTLTFDATLAGVADAVTFSFEVERTGYDDVKASVELVYPGRTITIEASGDNLDSDGSALGSLTLSNNDNVVMQLDADESIVNEDEEITGTIMIDGDTTEYGVLENVEGLDIIRYSDGTFVSAF